MASSSSSPSDQAQTLSSRSWIYVVFLSFRGEDTRNTFVGHLYLALEQEGIYTYKDNETLPRGETIRPSLMKAIEDSQIAVIVFSKNYGDSTWCLDELAHIMKCRDTRGQTVLPIFYDVDPSEVRKQKGMYGEAFAKHESENKTKVEYWRNALVDASNISGWEPKHIANGHEAKGIKQIVYEISQKLQPLTSSADEKLIGLEARLQALKSEMQIGSGGVLMIGIWGVGGGGKTTLASAIYDEICRQFDGCCFVENVREESGRHGLGKLKEKILTEMELNKVGGGRRPINTRFCRRKVLIVLDDVDHLDQLKALAGSHDWFGEGSRILITTRDKHLLTAHKVNVIHSIRLLNNDEAIKLFCKHAYLDNRVVGVYEHLSKMVVSYSGGLPLALTVLGSFLCDKDIDEWRSALARLKEIPDTDIVGKLKVSFDGLKPVEKELFLDIACFFRREDEDDAMKILDDCGFHPVIGVKVLIQNALITNSNGMFDMHDLVQEMGHYIAKGEHPNNPEKYSRLWKEEDVLKICAMDPMTNFDMIQAIRYFGEDDDPIHLPGIVANMKNLRWIHWDGDFASPLLSNFPPRTLCCLMLSNNLQEQLWEGFKLLPNLKTIQLEDLPNLIMTPDFSGLPNLETFILYECECLKKIHPSIGSLERLVTLAIDICESLVMFPTNTGLQKLDTLVFRCCVTLFNLSGIQHQSMDNLGHHDLDNSGKEEASYIESSTDIFVDCWRCACSNLDGAKCCLEDPSSPHRNMKPCLHENDMNHIGLRFFFKDLRRLNLEQCSLGDEEMGSAVWELPNLQELKLGGNEFSRLNFSRLRLPRLKWLDVSWCHDLVEFSDLPLSIAAIDAKHCPSLESFGDISNCKWLWKVSLEEENKLVGDILIDSMLQGNAAEDYFINITLLRQIPKGFVGRMFRGRTYTLRLPDDWYNDFCGFLMCVCTNVLPLHININIKQEVNEDSLIKLWQEEPGYTCKHTCLGYVSFGSLRHIAFSNSSCTVISVSIINEFQDIDIYHLGVELVPRKSKYHHPQTTEVATDSSLYYKDKKTFTIEEDLESSIKIRWVPLDD